MLVRDPKLLDDEALKARIETYKRMDTTSLMPDDQRFIAARLRALMEEVLKRQEMRDEMDS